MQYFIILTLESFKLGKKIVELGALLLLQRGPGGHGFSRAGPSRGPAHGYGEGRGHYYPQKGNILTNTMEITTCLLCFSGWLLKGFNILATELVSLDNPGLSI